MPPAPSQPEAGERGHHRGQQDGAEQVEEPRVDGVRIGGRRFDRDPDPEEHDPGDRADRRPTPAEWFEQPSPEATWGGLQPPAGCPQPRAAPWRPPPHGPQALQRRASSSSRSWVVSSSRRSLVVAMAATSLAPRTRCGRPADGADAGRPGLLTMDLTRRPRPIPTGRTPSQLRQRCERTDGVGEPRSPGGNAGTVGDSPRTVRGSVICSVIGVRSPGLLLPDQASAVRATGRPRPPSGRR